MAMIQSEVPWTPLRSADWASSGALATARPRGSHGKPSCGSSSVSFSHATQAIGSRIASGAPVARRAATSVPIPPAAIAAMTNSAPK